MRDELSAEVKKLNEKLSILKPKGDKGVDMISLQSRRQHLAPCVSMG
jgi:hypothetical protein